MEQILERVKVEFRMMGEYFQPAVYPSDNWITWITHFGPGTCGYCASQNGKIFSKNQEKPVIPVHDHCGCSLQILLAILAGTATIDNVKGADYYVKVTQKLPAQYLTKKEAHQLGWKAYEGNLRDIRENAIIGGDIYKNRDHKLPETLGRIWYEADINYLGGYRNQHRLLFSNDGLIFVTYDHYQHFFEIG